MTAQRLRTDDRCTEPCPQIDNTGYLLRRGDIDLSSVPHHYLDPAHPHELLFQDTYSCVVWEGNTEVGETLDMDTFLRCAHVATHMGGTAEPTVAERHFEASNMARDSVQHCRYVC